MILRFFIVCGILNRELETRDSKYEVMTGMAYIETSKNMIQRLGERIKNYRIAYPMTQKELAGKSGVSLRCIQNFEHGEDIQLNNFIKLLHALDLAENMDLLIPDMTQRPSAFLEKTKTRKRAPKTQAGDGTFQWGDEA